MRHKGGGHKPVYRLVDFRRDKTGIPATVTSIEYDPNRTARIALLSYRDGEKRYIIAPNDIKVGQPILSGDNAEPVSGNSMPLRSIPPGIPIHNIELRPVRAPSSCGRRARWRQCRPRKATTRLSRCPRER
jgi:large subunit ribosomal protein L2